LREFVSKKRIISLNNKKKGRFMKKSMVLYLFFALFLLGCSDFNTSADWNSDKIRISTPAHLREFRDSVNAGNSFRNQTVVLTNHLELAAANEQNQWIPIGETEALAFRGTFDGGGWTIRGVYINRPNSDNQGFFGFLRGTVKNLGLLDIDIRGKQQVGGLVASKNGTIENSYVTGNVEGEQNVGGLAGITHVSLIRNSYAAVNVVADLINAGGLVGNNGGTIEFCYASGSVRGDWNVGGLAGINRGEIKKSYASGNVSGIGNRVGGLVGNNEDENATICPNSGAKTIAAMRETSTFIGWNFASVWKFEPLKNNGFPHLRVFH